jgi:hypothetical protein
MSDKRYTGNPYNLERLSGRLFFKPSGDNGFVDLGDVTAFKFTPDNKEVSGMFHTRAATEREVRRDAVSTTMRWEVTCQEHTLFNEALLLFGKIGADASQAAVTSDATVTLTDVVPGRVYNIGKFGLDPAHVSATVSSAAKTIGKEVDGQPTPANADLLVDFDLGRVKVNPAGSIVADDDVVVTYRCAQVVTNTITRDRQACESPRFIHARYLRWLLDAGPAQPTRSTGRSS